ncbi:S1 RNA-binding domain-containing protein [Mycoplasmopsis caviae]|uniref:S1 RNA-binding domain-containing protein n=1 Tax=Mycoplasmopsis caviae TaxID=55603 RepID=A0A3P8MF46_9BACT|nr:S1 RNA-binding domain-containing protein [Mycoplasmopsis caviae]UUD35701.1 S1 RNA-binding domain-containing protein [Mycoplasmopsis caviae]VDR41553.1 Uncharacterised protein [Mycoplasmopsis caviae]
MNHKGDILFGKITKLSNDGLSVLCNNDLYFIPRSLMCDWSRLNDKFSFRVGDRVNFIVEKIDYKNNIKIGNFKANHAAFLRSPFKENLANTKHGFKTLKAQIDHDIEVYNIKENDGNN